MRILVFGAGAVGQAVGCIFAAAGHEVDLVLRSRFADTIRSDGLRVCGIFGEFSAESGILGLAPSIDGHESKTYDYALITTKSYDTDTAVAELVRLRDQSFTVISMQNGCGNLEKVAARFGENRTLGVRVITGFEIERPGVVRITVTADDVHVGGCREGTVPRQAAVFAEALNSAGLPCVTTPYIKRDLFAKLLYSCALNPLGAVLRVHYGALGDDPSARTIMNGVIREVFAVIKVMDASTHWDSAEEYIDFFYKHQIPATYNHRSSMLQDIENVKRTEVDALTGYVSAQGHLYGVPTPICDMLSEQVRFMERNRAR